MQAKAIAKRIRMSARKARLVTRLIQGQRVPQAFTTLKACPQKAAPLVATVLKSAVANLHGSAPEDQVTVLEAYVNEGPRMKRAVNAPRGRALPIIKRFCHIHVTVSDGG
jgi:large subunit ribosomal protein L22